MPQHQIKVVRMTTDAIGYKLCMIDNTLEALQACVGGYIEPVAHRTPGTAYFVNERGLLIGLPRNPLARIAIQALGGRSQLLVGDAVITGVDAEGDCTDVPDAALRKLGII